MSKLTFTASVKKKNAPQLNFTNFEAIKLTVASPDQIRSWSFGEVKKPETINYRTFKPERDGLFCDRIFGPTKDWECHCGKYKYIKHKGQICDRCGVEVTESKVRRERFGHIELAVPVAHLWFLRKPPSRVGIMLNMKMTDLERVIYYTRYLVLEDLKDSTGKIILKATQLITEEEYQKYRQEFRDKLKVDIGADAIRRLLEKIDLLPETKKLHEEIKKTKSDAERARLIRKLRVTEGFLNSNTRPEWMILTVLPVIPPDLRPLVALEGGRFATSDLNDLYRRIINRNNRLRHIEQLKAPAVMINNEKRLLQEAVDALIDNESRSRPVTGAGNRPLKSLSDTLKGKQGRFRQNLLGKRVDYSGRSVIVVGPNLKLHQCGLPKDMALELFKPFIIRELIKEEKVTLKAARKMLERGSSGVWNILERVTRHHPIMLNRAPTLHRLGIQAFEPVLVEGKSIQLHPLTCAAFNADFDGDQMAVHVPISLESQLEARVLMMSTNNILSPASGRPIATPSQDMVLGACYLTKEKLGVAGEGKIFSSREEVNTAYQAGKADMHARIKVLGLNKIREDNAKDSELRDITKWKDYTTVGRVMFNDHLPPELGYVNKTVGKRELAELVERCYKQLGHHRTVTLLDELKTLGYHFATLAGVSISIDAMKIPPMKDKLVKDAQAQIKEIEKQAKQGLITESERYNKVIDIWTHVTDKVADIMFDEMKKDEFVQYKEGTPRFNSIFLMADSGARGSRQQVRQLAGMRGLMAKPQKKLTGGVGEIIESPIISNFREGLTVLEYFISTHGGRKGLADTALKTADAGYLTRRLVDVAHDMVVTIQDCKTINGVRVGTLQSGDEVIEKMEERIVGRVSLDNVVGITPDKDGELHEEVIVKRSEVITHDMAKKMVQAGIERIGIRSVLTCEAERGVCAKCYGVNPATGRLVEPGEAVGIIAAQSIGEPGTQLTLRTFHIGGTASRVVQRSEIHADQDGVVLYHNMRELKNKEGQAIVISRNAELILSDTPNRRRETYQLPYGTRLKVASAKKVVKGELLAEWDPHSKPIISETDGVIELRDVKEGVTLHKEKSKITGQIERVIIEHPTERLRPRIVIKKAGKQVAEYPLPLDTNIVIDDGDDILAGDVLAKIPQEVTKSKDITGGLPRVAELFEGRRPKNAAVVSEIDGIVHLGEPTAKGSFKVVVTNEETKMSCEYSIPPGRHLVVYEGDRVGVGESLSDGAVNPHDILKVKGPKEVQEHLVNEIQQVYRLQGVTINDKHIEIIVRQMLSNVRVTTSGDSVFLNGEIISKYRFEDERRAVQKRGGQLPGAQPILLGITKASLSSDSFISAASFQETTRVLTEAAVTGQIDRLRGLKENVSIGHLIPAGTGLKTYE
ncbi:MAG: DNA-directed RNA polymerase subunit beta' [Elusimicrobia bacterium RIFOXYA2_FULL_50_26]|nr:MAG: DNA-directed RNA polymerase subunit beta' [Elusimicrobia bacterium RIFOXYA2_FULL_50_26]OGS24586.1 MAG: DNA-directed RNA polymerase subunit beta' [Elusimicrobia bacterium RIFOXYB2_FULL_50_12]